MTTALKVMQEQVRDIGICDGLYGILGRDNRHGFTRRIRFQPNVTLLHSDRLVSTALSFIFFECHCFQKYSRRIASSVGIGKAL